MTFEDLELFWALAERQSITEAGKRVRVSQPTASRRLKALEEELGTTLVIRDSHPLNLTPHGFLFLDFADEVLQRYRTLTLTLNSNHSIVGTLTVATSSSPAARLVTRWMAHFVARHPGIHIRLAEMNSREVESHVLSGESTIGFMGVLPNSRELTAYPIGDDEIVLLAPRHAPFATLPRPVDWNQVKSLPFIVRTQGSGTQTIVFNALAQEGYTPPKHHVLEVASASALIDAVESGLGAGFVSQELLFRRDLVRSHIMPIKNFQVTRPFYLIYRSDDTGRNPVVRAFLHAAQIELEETDVQHP